MDWTKLAEVSKDALKQKKNREILKIQRKRWPKESESFKGWRRHYPIRLNEEGTLGTSASYELTWPCTVLTSNLEHSSRRSADQLFPAKDRTGAVLKTWWKFSGTGPSHTGTKVHAWAHEFNLHTIPWVYEFSEHGIQIINFEPSDSSHLRMGLRLGVWKEGSSVFLNLWPHNEHLV